MLSSGQSDEYGQKKKEPDDRHPSAITKQFGTQQIDVGDTVPAAYLHPFAVMIMTNRAAPFK
jgi:hypothetical protein